MKDLVLLFTSAVISSGLAGAVAFLVAKLAFRQAVTDAVEKTVARIYECIDKLSEEITELKDKTDTKIYDRIDGIYTEILDLKDNVQENYVTCKFCTMQHENVSAMNKAINAKLDILISERK